MHAYRMHIINNIYIYMCVIFTLYSVTITWWQWSPYNEPYIIVHQEVKDATTNRA